MDEDLALRPEWVPYTPEYTGFFSLSQKNEPKCPFREIINYLQ